MHTTAVLPSENTAISGALASCCRGTHLLPLRLRRLEPAVAVVAEGALDEPRRVVQPPVLEERLGLQGGRFSDFRERIESLER